MVKATFVLVNESEVGALAYATLEALPVVGDVVLCRDVSYKVVHRVWSLRLVDVSQPLGDSYALITVYVKPESQS